MANAVALMSAAEWSKLDKRTKGLSERAPFEVNANINQYPAAADLESLREKGSVLFVVARHGKKLVLVGAIEQPVRKGKLWIASRPSTLVIADISRLRKAIGSLETPHVIGEDVARRLRAAASYKPGARRTPTSTKPPMRSARISATIRALIEVAREELVDEYLGRLRSNPDELLEHGVFSLTVQSVFSGMYKTTAETLVVLREIAPYVEGPGVVHRLGILARRDVTPVQIANELVDAFAISAIDTFGTALAAIALDQVDRVPRRAQPLLPALMKHAASIKKALRS